MGTAPVLMYCTAACPFCRSAERLLLEKGARIEKIRVDLEPARRAEMMQKSGRRTVPQIWIGSRHVWLVAADRSSARKALPMALDGETRVQISQAPTSTPEAPASTRAGRHRSSSTQ